MRLLVFIVATVAVACGSTAVDDLETGGSAGQVTRPQGGTKTLANGGSSSVTEAGAAGSVLASGGSDEPAGAGQGGATSGESPGDAGHGGGVGGDSASEEHGGAGQGGAPVGGSGGGSGGGVGDPATGGQPSVPLPWKICQDGDVCSDSEVCVYDSDTTRVCTKIKDEFDRCDPYAPQSEEFLSGCDNQPVECQTPYRQCNWMSADAKGTRCPTLGRDTQGVRWYCGPPP